MKKSIIMMTAIIVMFTGCVKTLENEGIDETGVTILKGRVVEGTNHSPLSNIMVLVTNGSQTHNKATTTAEGLFELEVDYSKIDRTYYLLLDGGSDEIRKKEELRGMVTGEYDYHDMVLYSLPSFQYGGHTYQVAPDPGNEMTWYHANDYCNALTYYNLSGWRLPTIEELSQMFMERNSIGGFSGAWYWSSSESSSEGGAGNYKIMNFYNSGSIIWLSPVNNNHVRPIRKVN